MPAPQPKRKPIRAAATSAEREGDYSSCGAITRSVESACAIVAARLAVAGVPHWLRAYIRRAELADGKTSMTVANDLAVRRALELADVGFIDENGGGAWGTPTKVTAEKSLETIDRVKREIPDRVTMRMKGTLEIINMTG
jgi:hypothetical protein